MTQPKNPAKAYQEEKTRKEAQVLWESSFIGPFYGGLARAALLGQGDFGDFVDVDLRPNPGPLLSELRRRFPQTTPSIVNTGAGGSILIVLEPRDLPVRQAADRLRKPLRDLNDAGHYTSFFALVTRNPADTLLLQGAWLLDSQLYWTDEVSRRVRRPNAPRVPGWDGVKPILDRLTAAGRCLLRCD
jgi:hypothetical protein